MTVPEINDETLIVNLSVSITRITFNARTGRQNLRLTVEKASFCFNDLEQHTKKQLDGHVGTAINRGARPNDEFRRRYKACGKDPVNS